MLRSAAPLCREGGTAEKNAGAVRPPRERCASGFLRGLTGLDGLVQGLRVELVIVGARGELRACDLLAEEGAEVVLTHGLGRGGLVERQTQQDRRYQDMCDYYTTWAHQIKTPIAAMRLNLKNEDSPLSRRLLSDLMRVERYAEMVMAYLRVESPSTDYLLRRLCIDDAVKRAVRPFAGEFIARRLKLNYEETGLSAVSDEKWLVFVLEQILSNALKYTPEGGIHIYRSAPNTLTIQDTGIGIAPEDLPRVFEKGYTGLNGRSDLKASGIGLYLSKKVLTKLGHAISAESEPERGTAIHIDFTQRDVRE